jgi:hypothetical protein
LRTALVWALSALVVYPVDVFAFDFLVLLFDDAGELHLLQVATATKSFLTLTTDER